MIKLTKTKLVAMLLIASTLVMFNGTSVHAGTDTMTVDFFGEKTTYMSSSAYQYSADACTYGADPNSGVTCIIVSSTYTTKHKITGTLHTETKGPYSQANGVTVSFSAPNNHVSCSVTTVHKATYMGYERPGNTSATYN